MKKIGLLYDSISNNSGDAAIGICVKEYCDEQGFDSEIINPYSYDPKNYKTIIVGGGFLLREPGDEFYDHFRVKGRNILNGVGIAAVTDLEYLNNYQLVSVRSQAEKQVLNNKGVKNVNVVPCITTRMKGTAVNVNFSSKSIGIHLTADTLLNIRNIHEATINLPYDKVYIPFTHYNLDRSFMKELPGVERHLLLEDLDPKELFWVIGKMKFLVTSSLHASIFAYLQNIPFLTIYQEKTFNYFKDRHLENHIFYNDEDFVLKLKWLITNKHDFTKSIKDDRKNIEHHLENIKKIIMSIKDDPSRGKEILEQVDDTGKYKLKIEQLIGAIQTRDLLTGKLLSEAGKINKTNSTLNGLILEKDTQIDELKQELEKIQNTKYWKIRVRASKLLKNKTY